MIQTNDRLPEQFLPEDYSGVFPNVLAFRVENRQAVDYLMLLVESLNEVLKEISDNPIKNWDIKEYGENIELSDEENTYVLLPTPKEPIMTGFWLSLISDFETSEKQLKELARIEYFTENSLLDLDVIVRQNSYLKKTVHNIDYLKWFNEGLLGRDYHDRYEYGLSYTLPFDDLPKEEIAGLHPFSDIAYEKEEICYILQLPPVILEEYFYGYPPLLGPGIMKSLQEAGYDAHTMQLRYIEYVNQL